MSEYLDLADWRRRVAALYEALRSDERPDPMRLVTFRAARERSTVPIIGLTPKIATARKLALVWGVHSMTTDDPSDFPDMVARATRLATQDGFAEKGDRLVITAGVPFGTPGRTNVLRLARVGEDNP